MLMMQKQIAETSQMLWKAHTKDGKAKVKRSLAVGELLSEAAWTRYPAGLSCSSLTRFNLRTSPLQTKDVRKIDVEVEICFPDFQCPTEGKRWFCKVVRHVAYKPSARKRDEDLIFFYVYAAEGEKVDVVPQDVFHKAYLEMPVEMCLLATVVTKADFQPLLRWNQILGGLTAAEHMGLLPAEDFMGYASMVERMVTKELMQGGKEVPRERDARKAMLEPYLEEVTLSPLEVMASLANMGAMPTCVLWGGPA